MFHDTTSGPVASSSPSPSPLLRELWCLLVAHRPAVRQRRCFVRLCALVLGFLRRVSRPTITGVLLTLGLHDADGSAFYRLFSQERVDYDTLTRCYLGATLAQIPPEGPYVAVLDGTQLPRSSRRMPGTAWLKNPRTPPFKPGSHRAQRYLHLAALLPLWQGYSRALPLRFVPAFPPKAVAGAAQPCTEWAAGLAQLHWLRDELDAAGRVDQSLFVLGDGGFDVVDLWRELPERTTLLARTACNRALYALPPADAHRNRRYGARARTPQAWLAERAGWSRTTLTVRGRDLPLRYRVEGPLVRQGAPGRPLFLLVVKGTSPEQRRHWRRRDPAFYLVNAVQREDGTWALPWSAEELLAWAWQRWEVEVAHRAMKSDAGVGAAQCWSVPATVRAAQWQVWAYALGVLAGYRAWGYDRHPAALRPPGLWWHGAARWSIATLWRGYRQALDFSPGRTGTRGTWAEIEAALHHLDALLIAPPAA
jgi:DDE superfamily endonuclease